MSIMSRNLPPGTVNGRPNGPLIEEPMPPPQLQRQAVMDQLGTSPVASSPGQSFSSFSRGGKVTQLPTGGRNEAIGNLGAGVGAQVAGQAINQGARTAGETASKLTSFGSGAAGAATSAGIGLATGMIADKLRVKEEMPTFGGENGAITDDYGRRFEGTGGGVASNAVRYAGYGAAAGPIGAGIGAAAGAIKGLASKNAPSAYTDFRVEDAADAIGKQYQQSLGRPASEDEIKGRLVGQGWDPNGGDRWVGEKNLFGQLGDIRNSEEAKQFATRGAVMDQLGGGERTAATSVPEGAVADTAGPTAPGDPSAWNTDGYSAPGYVPPQAGPVPAGWDAAKWNNPNHQTPKYGVGRILSNFPPTVEGLTAAMGDIEKAYPGTTFNGKDKLSIPGVGTVDVLEGAGRGGVAWRWGAEGGDAAAPAPANGPAGSVDLGAHTKQPDVLDQDTLAKLKAELERIIAGTPSRDALMAQMGGSNG